MHLLHSTCSNAIMVDAITRFELCAMEKPIFTYDRGLDVELEVVFRVYVAVKNGRKKREGQVRSTNGFMY
jgi:hypothetical protein